MGTRTDAKRNGGLSAFAFSIYVDHGVKYGTVFAWWKGKSWFGRFKGGADGGKFVANALGASHGGASGSFHC